MMRRLITLITICVTLVSLGFSQVMASPDANIPGKKKQKSAVKQGKSKSDKRARKGKTDRTRSKDRTATKDDTRKKADRDDRDRGTAKTRGDNEGQLSDTRSDNENSRRTEIKERAKDSDLTREEAMTKAKERKDFQDKAKEKGLSRDEAQERYQNRQVGDKDASRDSGAQAGAQANAKSKASAKDMTHAEAKQWGETKADFKRKALESGMSKEEARAKFEEQHKGANRGTDVPTRQKPVEFTTNTDGVTFTSGTIGPRTGSDEPVIKTGGSDSGNTGVSNKAEEN